MTEPDWRSLYQQATWQREDNPQAALMLYRQARELARRGGQQPQEALRIDYTIGQIYLYDLLDFGKGLEVAVETALEARKPHYDDRELRFLIEDNLMCAYMGIDPHGYAPLIAEAIEQMKQPMPPTLDGITTVQWALARFALVMERWEEAEREIQRYLAMSQSIWHDTTLALALLGQLMLEQKRWVELLICAERGLTFMIYPIYSASAAELLAAAALTQHHLGQPEAAALSAQRAVRRAAASRRSVDSPYYDALCAYHENSGDPATALDLRRTQVAGMASKGQLYWEARARLALIRLLKLTGQPVADEAAQARSIIRKLRQPDRLLNTLSDLTSHEP